MAAAAVIGTAAGVLQLPVAFYLLCKLEQARGNVVIQQRPHL